MKPISKRNKGKRFERFVCREIEAEGLGQATRTPGSGSGKLKADVFSSLDWSIEAKHQKRIKILEWVDQAKREAEQGNFDSDKWLLVFNDPRSKPEFSQVYAVLDFWEFLKLLKKNKEPLIQEPDRDFRWRLERLKQACQDVIRRLAKNESY